MSPQPVTSPRVALLGVCYDGSSSYLRGPAGAPPIIREALWSEAGNPWTELGLDLSAAALDDEGDLAPAPDEDPEQVRLFIEAAVKRIAESGRRPLLLGGDHSITYPILRGFRPFHPRLSILHFDAHGDLWDEFEGDRYSHACPFARIMEEGLTDRLVQVGIRTMNGHQREQARRFGVKVIEMKDWRDGTKLEFDTPLYVSFDLDVIEPGLAPGISHREAGGFSVRQALAIVQSLTAPVVGADFVEFNPAADRTGVTAAVSAKLVKELAARMLVENR
ncbi:MAG TPA: agmatinase family protein [Gemmatimonadales bacterium]|nr:agmatinase family protein [Gemmatimonadales bacterium]